MSRHRLSRIWLGVGLAFVFVFLIAPCLGLPVPFEPLYRLTFGWIGFLQRVGPQIRIDGELAALSLATVVALTIGLHFFLAWLYRSVTMPPSIPADGLQTTLRWRWKWTVSFVAIVLMMFVAGTSLVGIFHQCAWLATGPEPIIEGGGLVFSAKRMQAQNNLKEVGFGFLNFHDTYTAFPAGTMLDETGQALHGWQTQLLPFLNYSLEQIDLQKPWSDSANRESFEVVVPAYQIDGMRLPKHDEIGYALSHHAGNSHVLGGAKSWKQSQISDGTSNTILVGEAKGNFKPWGHPRNWRDPALGINTSPDGFGGPWPGGGAQFGLADGSVRYVREDIDPKVLRALATPAGADATDNF